MGNFKLLSLLIVFFTLWGCNQNAKQQDLNVNVNVTRWLQNCDNCNAYITNINHVKMHESADKDSKLLCYLIEGEIVEILEESTDRFESFTLRGVLYDEPWVQIKTRKGKIGWIFRGALDVVSEKMSPKAEKLVNDRLNLTFGEDLAALIKESSINLKFKNVVDILTFYKETKILLPKVNKVLRNEFISRENVLPRLAWLEVCFPFCSIYQSNNNFYYFLDFDYDKMRAIAYKTPDEDDDRFIDLMSSMHKLEGDYVINLWEDVNENKHTCNNIGNGDYLRILKALNDAYTNNLVFKEEILTQKNKVIKSLVRNRKSYCLKKEAISSELAYILKAQISILGNNDIGELRELAKRFK